MDPRKLLPILALLVTIALPTEDLANDFVPSWHLLKHNVFFYWCTIHVVHSLPR